MKNPFSFLTRKNLETSFGVLMSRFPVASIIVVVLAGFLFYIVQAETDSVTYLRIILSLIVTFFLSIGVSLFVEGNKVKHGKIWHIAPVIYGILFYISMIPLTSEWMMDSVTYFILHLVGFICLLFFAPYVRNIFYKKEQSIEYANYFTRTAWALLMSVIVGGSLVALGFIAIGSVIALFDLSSLTYQYKIYAHWAIIALSLVAPLYCLIHLPTIKELEKRNYEINRFFSFLIRYIATPFIVLYFIILYVYSAKVLLNFHDWPKGMISWMVIGFSSFGYLTYIFSKSYEEESRIITIFRTYFPYAVPAQILMLAYAIYLRIAQYDLTMNRYFVVIFGCWLALISAYYILSQKKSLTVVTSSLTAIALIISVGPWSVYRLPLIRQYNHLVQNLTTAGMYKDGVILKKGGTIDTALENDIYSEIEYVCGFSHCEKIKTLFSKELAGKEEEYEKKWDNGNYNPGMYPEEKTLDDGKKYPGMNQWEIVNEVTTAIGISQFSKDIMKTAQSTISIYPEGKYKNAYSVFPIDTQGYNSILEIYSSENITACSGALCGIVDYKNKILEIKSRDETGSKTIDKIPLESFIKNLEEKYSGFAGEGFVNVNPAELSFTSRGSVFEVKLFFTSFSIKNPHFVASNPYDQTITHYASGYALIRKK